MRLEAVKGASRPFTASEGVPAVFEAIAALEAILGVVALLLIQGRGDAREFGEHLGVFFTSAEGELVTGRRICSLWVDPYVPAN